MTVSEPLEDSYVGLDQLAMRVPSRREAAEVLGIQDAEPIYGDEARRLICGQPVLITGAGGSIGSELVRQLTWLGASSVICVDRDEYGLYRLQLELTGQALLTSPAMVLADVADRHQMDRIMAEHRPVLVFHAAACKHLPLMERSPAQAIITNIEGTANVAATAALNHVWRLVNISTDKAADPTCVLGQTKRLAEDMTRQYAGPRMRVASVRFGNVYGSRGSFIETLAYQVEHDLPVTVTDPGMTRYFMTIPQAAGLVIQAAVLADSTSTFVLDMGEPYLVTDLVERYAKATGHAAPHIIVTGRRPGEKTVEQLTGCRETPHSTSHPQILAVHAPWNGLGAVGTRNLVASARAGGSPDELRTALAELTELPVEASS
jgi:FlaA1/EpsC-like NDP-sugar epimerase